MIKTELVWELDRIVQKTSDALFTQLQEVQPGIVGINFQFGSPTEIKVQHSLLGKGDRRAEKWPLISLYRPYDEMPGGDEYERVKLTLLISNYTTSGRLSRDRQIENFEPILLPIYRELMRQIARSKFFVVMNPATDMRHTKMQHDYFGKESTPDAKRPLQDFADAIEIRDLELKLSNSTNCC